MLSFGLVTLDGLNEHYVELDLGSDAGRERVKASGAEQPVASEIDPASDPEWHTHVDLVLMPDETLTPSQRHGVEIDYGMKGGKVTITCRQAMLFYALRTLNFELNGLPREGERQLVIRQPR